MASDLATRPDRAAAAVRRVTPVLAPATLLVLLLPLATRSLLLGVVAIAGMVLLTMVLALGAERTAMTLLVVGVALAPLNDVRPVDAITFVTASDVFLVVAIALLGPTLLARRFPVQVLFLVGAAGVGVAGLLTSAISPDPVLSLNHLLRFVVGALALPLVFMVWRPGRAMAVALAAAYVAGNAFNAVYARVDGTASFDGRYPGLSTHVNVLGLCAMLGVALVPFLLANVPRQWTWLVLLGGALSAYGVWLSGSRAALLVAVAITALYPLLARSVPAALALFGLAIAPLYVVGNALVEGEAGNNPLGRLLGGGSASASDLQREELIDVAVRQFLDNPVLGGGFGEVLEAHNIYLQIAAAAGIVGTAFYLVLLASVVREPFVRGGTNRLLALPALSYVMVGLMTPLLWDRYIWCVLALPFLVPSPSGPDGGAEPVTSETTPTQESR